MKTKSIIIYFLILIGCNLQQNELKTFNLCELPACRSIKLSELGFVDIEYIPLETNENSLIYDRIDPGSLFDKIIAGKDFFIIKHFNSILKFSNKGSFVAKIGKVGRGPDEFQTCHDIVTDEEGKLIYILDGWKRKVFIYSDVGELMQAINFPLAGLNYFCFVENRFLCYTSNHLGNVENSFNLIDTTGTIIKSYSNKYSFKKTRNDVYGIDNENLFYKYNGRLYKKEVYSDTVFLYENMIFKPYMIIKVGDKLLTPQARSEVPSQQLAKDYIAPRNLFEFGNYVFYDFRYKFEMTFSGIKSEYYSFIGSKTSNFNALINNEIGLINDLDGGPNVLPLTIKDDHTIVGWIEVMKLKEHVSSEIFKNSIPKYPEKKKELEKLAASLKETDNPVLVLVRLKK